jgi:hypothetical protein
MCREAFDLGAMAAHRPPGLERCLPYRVGHRPGVGRVLLAVRDIRPGELAILDRAAAVLPETRAVCLGCLLPLNPVRSPKCQPEVPDAKNGSDKNPQSAVEDKDTGSDCKPDSTGTLENSSENSLDIKSDNSSDKLSDKLSENSSDIKSDNRSEDRSEDRSDKMSEDRSNKLFQCPDCALPFCKASCAKSANHKEECK